MLNLLNFIAETGDRLLEGLHQLLDRRYGETDPVPIPDPEVTVAVGTRIGHWTYECGFFGDADLSTAAWAIASRVEMLAAFGIPDGIYGTSMTPGGAAACYANAVPGSQAVLLKAPFDVMQLVGSTSHAAPALVG